LVVYSDGITEALNESDAFFGDERLLASLTKLRGGPPWRLRAGFSALSMSSWVRRAGTTTCRS